MTFSLPSSITIETVDTLAADIKRLGFDPKDTLVLDGSRVEIITTPGIQLLLALHRTLNQSGGRLVIKSFAQALIQSFQVLGLQAQLMAWGES